MSKVLRILRRANLIGLSKVGLILYLNYRDLSYQRLLPAINIGITGNIAIGL